MKTLRAILILCVACLAGTVCSQEAPVYAHEWSFDAPPSAVWRQTVDADWRGYAAMAIDVTLADGAPDQEILCSVFFETKQDWWFETRQTVRLTADGHRFVLRLDDLSPDWQAPQLRREYGPDVLRWVRSWGIKIFTAEPVKANLKISKLTLTPIARQQHPQVVDLEMPISAVAGQLAPVRFRLNSFHGDVFDPQTIQVWLDWTGDSGRGRVPGFFRQDFETIQVPGRLRSQIVPRRLPAWQTNWVPPKPGTYTLRLTVETSDNHTITSELAPIRVEPAESVQDTPAAPPANFLEQVRDRRAFVFQDGDWHNPDGPSYVSQFWYTQLAWISEWGHYTGLGEFEQQLAWQLEQEIRAADPNTPQPILLFGENELNNHGIFNWVDHPLNAANGGPLQSQRDWFNSPEVRQLLKRRARYLWARYGTLPQVSGILISLPRPYDTYVVWLSSLARELAAECPDIRLLSNNPGLPARVDLERLEYAGRWETDQRLSEFTFISADPSGKEILVEGRYPGSTAILARDQPQHWNGARVFAVDIHPSEASGDEVKVLCMIRTDPHTVFQTELHWLRENEWNRVYFPLDDPSAWTCLGDSERELQAWDLLNIEEVGLRFFCDQANEVALRVRNSRLLGDYEIDRRADGPLAIRELSGDTKQMGQYELMELDFQLNREFRNPYDPRQVDVSIAVSGPDGRLLQHPGFFYEPWSIQLQDGAETLRRQPRQSSWKLRFTPTTPGEYRWILTVRTPEETARTTGRFTCTPQNTRGFVQISPQDPRMFEFSDGSFFFPIGHNLRSPSDRRPGIYRQESLANADWADRMGTFAFEEWFKKMAANGKNFTRIWMCPWWIGLEWNASYPEFHGLGFYSQQNAARLDRLLNLAREHGIYINLETLHHGALSSSIDSDWPHNPLYDQQPGGFLRYAGQFFESEEAQRLNQQRLRYTIARWGYSPQIAFWGIITESEWVEPYFRGLGMARPANAEARWTPHPYRTPQFMDQLREWLVDTGAYMKEINAHPHLVTTHFSNPPHGTEMWARQPIEIVHNNAYTMFTRTWQVNKFSTSNGVADIIHEYGIFFGRWKNRPLLLGEWGGHPHQNQERHLIAELHTGLWASFMSDLSGVTGFWWWNLLDAHNQYQHFAAIAAFAEGEDRRGKNYVSERAPVHFSESASDPRSQRAALVLHNPNTLFAYIYNQAINTHNRSMVPTGFEDPQFPESGIGQLVLPPTLAPGNYEVEYWDTFAGKVIRRANVQITEENRKLLLPSHRVDLAIKLKSAPGR